jgi:hypothetical protein
LPIPHQIAENETIIRAIFHPLFFSVSKRKIKNLAFLPNPNHSDLEQRKRVSVYRKNYSSENVCKNLAVAIKMNGQSYIGFAAFMAHNIKTINELPEIKIKAQLLYTPMNMQNRYISLKSKKFYVDDSGFPMHAEIVYDIALDMDNPNTGHRLYADKLVEIVKNSVYIDPHPEALDWFGEEINYKTS